MVTPLSSVRSVAVAVDRLVVGVVRGLELDDLVVVVAVLVVGPAAPWPTAAVPVTPPQAASTNTRPDAAAAVTAVLTDIRMISSSELII
jgi:hypothetical protein